MARTIAIVDYKIGNRHSIASALIHVANKDDKVCLTSEAQVIQNCSHLIFPGVGAIKGCREALIEHGLLDSVRAHIEAGKPLFAICVGMQLLFTESSENGGVAGFNLFTGTVVRLRDDHSSRIKVPHIGWNSVAQLGNHWLWHDVPDESQFYFVHSYAVVNKERTIGMTSHGDNAIVAAVAKDKIVATQFHPEKSHRLGLQLLRNFLLYA